MKRLCYLAGVALMLAMLTVALAGCGGGGDEDTAPPAKKAKTNGGAGANADASAVEPDEMPELMVGQAVVPTNESPDDFTEAIEEGFPVVITFYQPLPYDDNEVRSSMLDLESRYRGQAEFLSYLYSDSQRYGDLVSLLKVNTTPSVIIINRMGQVHKAWTGYADSESLEQGIVEVVEGT